MIKARKGRLPVIHEGPGLTVNRQWEGLGDYRFLSYKGGVVETTHKNRRLDDGIKIPAEEKASLRKCK